MKIKEGKSTKCLACNHEELIGPDLYKCDFCGGEFYLVNNEFPALIHYGEYLKDNTDHIDSKECVIKKVKKLSESKSHLSIEIYISKNCPSKPSKLHKNRKLEQ